jgi:alanine racemase
MVKADGYGLGVAEVVRAFAPSRPYGWGVATVCEGRKLLELDSSRPAYVFSPIPPQGRRAAVDAGLIPSISTVDELTSFAGLSGGSGRSVAVQLEVDTGMGRGGLPAAAAGSWWPLVRAEEGVSVVGVWTHLHSADEPELEPTRRQIETFRAVLSALHGLADDCLVHVANSAACFRAPCSFANAARPGIFLYGGRVGDGAPLPREVVRVVGRVGLVRDMPPGATLGYGATYRASGPERWATVTIGYGDGLPRVLGNVGQGLVGGRPVPIIGRISMDVTVVDITGAGEVRPGDLVTFIGSDGDGQLALDDVAALAGTIGYEVLTGLSPRLPRIWAEQS